MQGFTTIDLIILIVYLAAVLFAGLFFSKKEMKGKEFFKGDGTIPWWVTSVSIFATLLSPISFLSLAGNSYAGTWIMWFAQLGMLVAIPITIKFFLPIYSSWTSTQPTIILKSVLEARACVSWAPSCSSYTRWAVCPSSCIFRPWYSPSLQALT